jgi:CBS domain-containing protein
MKVAFFLTLKSDVVYLPLHATMRQALERMEHHRYTAIPVLDREGRYAGTLTEGDLLWKMKHTPGMTFADCENIRLADVPRHVTSQPIHIDAEMEELLGKALDQNFVPVVDGRGVFIGIVRRRDLIQYCLAMVQQQRDEQHLGTSLRPHPADGHLDGVLKQRVADEL